MLARKFDLEDRLLEFAARIIRLVQALDRSPAGLYVGDQLMRAGTSPYGHHGEAEGAESRADFIHKLRVCYKELREARRWLRLIDKVPLVHDAALMVGLTDEAKELILIFAASLR